MFVRPNLCDMRARSEITAADILADLILICVPVRLFLNSRLEAGLKTRLIIIFSASILTTVVSLVHAYYLLRVGGTDVLISAIVEVCLPARVKRSSD